MEGRPFARDRSAWANGFGAASVLVSIALVLALAGMLYETVARRYAAVSIPAPGELIDLGGRRVHLDCRGKGSPTVLLESGLDSLGSMAWSRVHGPLARTTRVCAYDRAGFLWSDPQHQRRDAISIAMELRAVLTRAKERGPYVMVGHGIGGAYAVVFSKIMKSEVLGVVLLDSVHPQQDEHFARALGMREIPLWMRARDRFWRFLGPFWATVGVVRLSGVKIPPDADEETARIANAFGPPTREAIWSEESAFQATLREQGAMSKLGDRYLTVLTADPPPSTNVPGEGSLASQREKWLDLQIDMTHWSTRSHHEVVRGSRHHIQLSKPGAVISAVEDMLGKVRAK